MLYIEEIECKEKLLNILKEKYNILNKLENKINIIYKFLENIIFFYMSLFNRSIKKVIAIENDGISCNILYIITKENVLNERCVGRILKVINKNSIRRVVLTNTLNQNEFLKNSLYANEIKILDGKILAEFLVYKMIEYISDVQKRELETYEISILINDKNDVRMEAINKVIKKCNVVNIVTNKVSQFEGLKEELKRKYGICLNVTTNINKTLLKSDIIINFDFVAELYSKCVIPEKTVIINIFEEIKIYSSTFKGINITDYMIYIPEEYKQFFKKMKNFNVNLIYESILFNEYTTKEEIKRKIEKDNIKIRYFKGNNDKIRGREFLSLTKIARKK